MEAFQFESTDQVQYMATTDDAKMLVVVTSVCVIAKVCVLFLFPPDQEEEEETDIDCANCANCCCID